MDEFNIIEEELVTIYGIIEAKFAELRILYESQRFSAQFLMRDIKETLTEIFFALNILIARIDKSSYIIDMYDQIIALYFANKDIL